MTQERISIRATTKVVRQPKPETPWTLERVRLARKHSASLYSAQIDANVRADQARQTGRREGREEIANSMLADAEFRKHFLRAAAEELGAKAGKEIDRWARDTIDPVLEQRKQILNGVLNMAVISSRFEDTPMREPAVMTRVEFPRREFAIGQIVPRW